MIDLAIPGTITPAAITAAIAATPVAVAVPNVGVARRLASRGAVVGSVFVVAVASVGPGDLDSSRR